MTALAAAKCCQSYNEPNDGGIIAEWRAQSVDGVRRAAIFNKDQSILGYNQVYFLSQMKTGTRSSEGKYY